MAFTKLRLSTSLPLSRTKRQAHGIDTFIGKIKRSGGALIVASALVACGGGGGGGGGDTQSASGLPGAAGAGSAPGIAPSATGVASLTWDLPATTAEGKPLRMSDLAGYRVYTGTVPYNLQPVTTISDSSATTYTVTGLTPGVHYFAVTALNAEGAESSFSAVQSKSVD